MKTLAIGPHYRALQLPLLSESKRCVSVSQEKYTEGNFQCLSTQGKGEGFVWRRIALGFGKVHS